MEIPESYYKTFFQVAYFVHNVILVTPTEVEDTYIQTETVGLKINLNLN